LQGLFGSKNINVDYYMEKIKEVWNHLECVPDGPATFLSIHKSALKAMLKQQNVKTFSSHHNLLSHMSFMSLLMILKVP